MIVALVFSKTKATIINSNLFWAAAAAQKRCNTISYVYQISYYETFFQ